jgi:hypothetical protein
MSESRQSAVTVSRGFIEAIGAILLFIAGGYVGWESTHQNTAQAIVNQTPQPGFPPYVTGIWDATFVSANKHAKSTFSLDQEGHDLIATRTTTGDGSPVLTLPPPNDCLTPNNCLTGTVSGTTILVAEAFTYPSGIATTTAASSKQYLLQLEATISDATHMAGIWVETTITGSPATTPTTTSATITSGTWSALFLHY